jgi:hypothetical protein
MHKGHPQGLMYYGTLTVLRGINCVGFPNSGYLEHEIYREFTTASEYLVAATPPSLLLPTKLLFMTLIISGKYQYSHN